VLGAAEDGSSSVSGGTHATLALRCHVKDEHVKDAAQGVSEDVAQDVPQDVAQELAFGARAARALLASLPPPSPPPLCSSR